MEITQAELQQMVAAVVQNLTMPKEQQNPEIVSGQRKPASIYDYQASKAENVAVSPVQPLASPVNGKKGVFGSADDAVDAAHKAQVQYAKDFLLEDRKRLVEAIRTIILANKETLARMAVEETGLGRYEDKIGKVALAAEKTPGVEMLETRAVSGDAGLTIEEMAPFGVIGAVSPVTNPMETIVNNSIGILAAGNSVVFNVHPSSKNTCVFTVDLINKAVVAAGGPENLVTMVENPTIETLDIIAQRPEVRLLLGTGGPGLVKKLLSSGKKAIGAAAGNPPVIVDDTADLHLAAREIIKGASFDNNLLCIAEKEVFVLNSVADDLFFEMIKQGAHLLTPEQAEKVTHLALEKDANGIWHTKKEWIGKDAHLFLQAIGVQADDLVKLLVFEAHLEHPFVQLEQMMPVLSVVRVPDLDTAIAYAVKAEHGNRHTASMFSQNIAHLTKFARAVNTTIFVKNAATLAGVGFGGEGYTTFTIAGATGEGLTCAKTFTRTRRCVLGEGGFRIL